MSDLIPHYGGRDGTWDFNYGSWTYGTVMEEVDSDCKRLPLVDYGDVSHDSWTTRMSLRAGGLPMEFWKEKLDRKDGPSLRIIGDDITHDA